METSLGVTVFDDHVEAARHGDDELMAAFQCMPCSVLPPWDVVEIEHSLYGEWQMTIAFNETKISTRVMDSWQVDQLTVVDGVHG